MHVGENESSGEHKQLRSTHPSSARQLPSGVRHSPWYASTHAKHEVEFSGYRLSPLAVVSRARRTHTSRKPPWHAVVPGTDFTKSSRASRSRGGPASSSPSVGRIASVGSRSPTVGAMVPPLPPVVAVAGGGDPFPCMSSPPAICPTAPREEQATCADAMATTMRTWTTRGTSLDPQPATDRRSREAARWAAHSTHPAHRYISGR